MRLIRFMSAAEAIYLLGGRSVANNTVHRKGGAASTSEGFCFAIEDRMIGNVTAMQEASKFLSGITDMDICLVAELSDPQHHRFKRSQGQYRDGVVEEMCAPSYQLNIFDHWEFWGPDKTRFSIIAIPSSLNWQNPRLVASDRDWPHV